MASVDFRGEMDGRAEKSTVQIKKKFNGKNLLQERAGNGRIAL
jgi:hypothetical protein